MPTSPQHFVFSRTASARDILSRVEPHIPLPSRKAWTRIADNIYRHLPGSDKLLFYSLYTPVTIPRPPAIIIAGEERGCWNGTLSTNPERVEWCSSLTGSNARTSPVPAILRRLGATPPESLQIALRETIPAVAGSLEQTPSTWYMPGSATPETSADLHGTTWLSAREAFEQHNSWLCVALFFIFGMRASCTARHPHGELEIGGTIFDKLPLDELAFLEEAVQALFSDLTPQYGSDGTEVADVFEF